MRSIYGFPPLDCSGTVQYEKVKVVQVLLEHGTDVGDDGIRVPGCKSDVEHEEVMQLLLSEHGCQVGARCNVRLGFLLVVAPHLSWQDNITYPSCK
jgi:hypothetical protein